MLLYLRLCFKPLAVLLLLFAVFIAEAQSLASLTFKPSSLVGGGSATGTVTLTAPLSSGTKISLNSQSSSVTVPSSVTISTG
jgi:hypothetical protein